MFCQITFYSHDIHKIRREGYLANPLPKPQVASNEAEGISKIESKNNYEHAIIS